MSDSNKTALPGPPTLATLRRSLTIPTTEPQPRDDDPWKDDLFSRRTLARNLTDFIRPQQEPLVISLHGAWGSGKTFFLRRWIRDLQKDGFSTFYYNAWEDDYTPTPLIPILASLEDLTKTDAGRKFAATAQRAATHLLFKAPLHILKSQTGIDFTQIDLDPASLLTDDDAFVSYRSHRTHRDNLRTALSALTATISTESDRPAVCVIDELDRCRPTFAIELLETLKHVFNVPRLVFLLAMNRTELVHSIRSVYGEINAETYLRRFFDVNLDLPAADTVPYSNELLARFGLDTFFENLTPLAKSAVHRKDYRVLADFLPLFWRQLRLSLRDIHHCVTSLSLVCRNLQVDHFLYPPLLVALLAIRLRDADLYRGFVSGDISPGAVYDRLDSWVHDPDIGDVSSSDKLSRGLHSIEASLYAVTRDVHIEREDDALTQVAQVAKGEQPSHPDVLSIKARADSSHAKSVLSMVAAHHHIGYRPVPLDRSALTHLANLMNFVAVSDDAHK